MTGDCVVAVHDRHIDDRVAGIPSEQHQHRGGLRTGVSQVSFTSRELLECQVIRGGSCLHSKHGRVLDQCHVQQCQEPARYVDEMHHHVERNLHTKRRPEFEERDAKEKGRGSGCSRGLVVRALPSAWSRPHMLRGVHIWKVLGRRRAEEGERQRERLRPVGTPRQLTPRSAHTFPCLI